MPKTSRMHMDLTAKECDLLTANANLSEQEIRQWHTDFLRQFPSGLLDKKSFVDYYKKFHAADETSIEDMFSRIDINDDGTIDFNELLALIAIRKKIANVEQRLEFVFDLWDDSDDGHIDRKELTNWISAMYYRAGVTNQKGEWDPKKRAKEIISKLDVSGDKKLSKQEFVNGCKNDPVIYRLLVPNI